MGTPTGTPTVRERILDHAIILIMERGYNGFSYRDLSELVGVKTSSIHYYFPSKEDLVLEAVNEYSDNVLNSMQEIDAALPADTQLAKYAELFDSALSDGNQICLCGMLAADIRWLPESVRLAVQTFFTANESWLAKVLAQGLDERPLAVNCTWDSAARMLFAAYQGSMLASRLFRTAARRKEIEAAWKIMR
ncbi:TetR/AcrR family transcriptional regulator [Paraburkholderia phytofirmans]|uniref:TetR family transcriptional regulator n=1 Tax=Paraburkholderia phytofirmans OLGA172 TaxID=1417228 RepID=A0A160FR55_9BURK|nr:TetR/AcrR family transcriptional regulator [Paraburkholderia phytofirmans]ANB75281.1 TetR family transcriptional regulator [Paraburkholderia phytofirmans OLGA172]